MTLQQRVSAIISGRAPQPVCDSCVADHLAISRRQACAARNGARGRFRRFNGRCAGCCTDRMVTMLAAAESRPAAALPIC